MLPIHTTDESGYHVPAHYRYFAYGVRLQRSHEDEPFATIYHGSFKRSHRWMVGLEYVRFGSHDHERIATNASLLTGWLNRGEINLLAPLPQSFAAVDLQPDYDEPVCVMSCERCEPEVSAACDSEGSHAEDEQPDDDPGDGTTAHVVGKLTGGSVFKDGAVLLNVNRTSVVAYAHDDRPLACQRTDKGYGKRGEFTVSAPAGQARSLRVDGKGSLTVHLTTEEARDLLDTLTTILAPEPNGSTPDPLVMCETCGGDFLKSETTVAECGDRMCPVCFAAEDPLTDPNGIYSAC
jgi:hypothetical protein